MKRFIFIYALSFILCLSPFIYADELASADENTLTSTGSAIAADAGAATDGAIELPQDTGNSDSSGTAGNQGTPGAIDVSAGSTTTGGIQISEPATPYETVISTSPAALASPAAIDTTTSDAISIPEEGIPGGAANIANPEAISTTEASITTTSGSILPADGTENSLLAAPMAAAGSGGYMSLTVAPAAFDMGTLSPNGTYTFTGKATLTISTKSNWNLQVSGTDFSDGINTIPVSRVKCKVSTSANYTTLSSTPADILTNQPKAWPGNVTVQIDYQITILPTDPAGSNYQNNITFTVY